MRKKYSSFPDPTGLSELQIVVLLNNKDVYAALTLDGQPIGDSPAYRPVRPGKHLITVERRPLPISEIPIVVTSKKSVRVEIELAPLEEVAQAQ